MRQKKAGFGNRVCKHCGTTFPAKRKWHDFCSVKCRVENWGQRNTDPSKVAELDKRLGIVEKKLGIER